MRILPVCCNCFLQKIIMLTSEHNSTEHQYKEFHTLPCSASDSFILCLFGCAWITFMNFLYFFSRPPLWGASCWRLPWSLKDSSRPAELLVVFFTVQLDYFSPSSQAYISPQCCLSSLESSSLLPWPFVGPCFHRTRSPPVDLRPPFILFALNWAEIRVTGVSFSQP